MTTDPAHPDHPGDQDWRETLRARGLRLTPQRELVLAAVRELRHATPDQVHAHVRARSEAVNLSTVYRTLEVLEDAGLIKHAHLSDRAPTYHAVDDDHEHFHLVCRRCKKVTSVATGALAPLNETLRDRYGFVPDAAHLTVFGTCEGECCPDEHDHD
ncbi:MAG: transcriptional repressor [Nocardioides sp.]|nr:transcriptional repressor [Nocardioides sp.]